MPDIRPAQSSWDLVDRLKREWDVRVYYMPIRIAIGRSLRSGDMPDVEKYPSDGRSIDIQQIFSGGGTDYTPLFRALIAQRHGRSLNDDEFLRLLKAHVDHGFELIKYETEKFKNNDEYLDYLVELAQFGLDQRTQETHTSPEIIKAFDGVLTLEIGEDAKTNQPVSVEFNKRTNNYLAVAGKPGSGKTQFVKDILAQLRKVSDYKLNFIFFDYAKGDVADDEKFVEATKSQVVKITKESLPLNPFSRVNVESEMSIKLAAQEFADTVRDVERNIGSVQVQTLYDAILTAFEVARGENPPYPDFLRVRQEVDYTYFNNNRRPDTLTEVMRQLTDFKVFAPANEKNLWSSLCDRTVIIDLHELTVLRELTVFFVLNSMYRELMVMPDTEVINGARSMRTIVVIDEAHHYLKDKKRNRILQKLIREIRSKGASVFLLSQSPDDFDQSEFDFTELLEFIFVLQSSADKIKFLQNALGITSQRAKALAAEVSNLPTAQGFSKSFDMATKDDVSRLNLRQFWRDFKKK